ncbi:unnamed protein product [Commensalibacter communis]|nr:unnamed protein product [Commensalibacter communis]
MYARERWELPHPRKIMILPKDNHNLRENLGSSNSNLIMIIIALITVLKRAYFYDRFMSSSKSCVQIMTAIEKTERPSYR